VLGSVTMLYQTDVGSPDSGLVVGLTNALHKNQHVTKRREGCV
jgi:hypothetical protein